MSGSFFDNITDPTTDALIGAAQGFAQAAMPSRMPTPFGAALGMAGAGALQGVKSGQSLALGQQQLQQAKIANQRAQMLMDWYKNAYGGSGDGSGGTPMGTPGQPGSGGGSVPGYLVPPQQLRTMGDLAMATGNDRTAAALYGLPQAMAGGAGYAMLANGTAIPTPGGAADPRTAAALAFAKTRGDKAAAAPYEAPISVDVPEYDAAGNPTGNTVKQQIPVQQWAAMNNGQPPVPGQPPGQPPLKPGALPADPFPGWAKQINQNENPTGNPAQTNPLSTASGNGQFLDGTWPQVLRATRPDLAAGRTDAELMPLRNDPALAASATEAYARQNGASLASRGLPVNGTTIAMAHMFGAAGASAILSARPDAPLAMLPGMGSAVASNPQFRNMTAGQVVQTYGRQMGTAPQPPQYGGGVTLSPQNQAALDVEKQRQTTQNEAAVKPVTVTVPDGQGGYQEITTTADKLQSIMGPDAGPAINRAAIGGKVVLSPQQAAALDVQTSNAKALGSAAADRTKLITTRAGVFDPVTGKEIYRQPEYHETQDPNTGTEYPSFVAPGENGTLSITGGPPGMNGATPPTKLGPGQEDTIKHLADQYANEDKQKYEGATNSLFQLDQQDRNIAALNSGGGWSSTGTGANAKMEWAKGINSAFQTIGVAPPIDPTKVSSWEDATKIQTQLAFAQAKQLGSREAQQVISMSRAATPGAENTPQGYQAISSGYHEMNNREVDLYNFKTQWLQSHGGNLAGAETAFNNQYSPTMYADRAVSTVHPIAVQSDADLAKYLPGTMVRWKGNVVQVPASQGGPQTPGYLQNFKPLTPFANAS